MARRLIGSALLLLAFCAFPASDVFGQKKKKEDKPADTKPAMDSDKLKATEFVGLLKSTPGSDRTFTVDVEQVTLVPKKGAKGGGKPNNNVQRVLAAQSRLQQAEARVLTARTPQARQQAYGAVRSASQQLTQAVAAMNAGGAGGAAAAGYDTKTSYTKVEFQLAEKVKVRSLSLPEVFDEKGEIKKYSSKELAELKGKDRSLPGYESALDKLELGQRVKVTLAAAPKKSTGTKDPDKDEPMDDDKKGDKSKQVKLIVIVTEAASGLSTPKGKGKK